METTTTAPQTADAQITGILADLAAVTDRLISTVRRAAAEQQVRLPAAGGILASTSRLTAAAVEVLSAVTHRGVIADEGLTIGSWLRSFAGCTIADERTLDLTANRLADMPTLRRWFADGAVSWSVVRGVVYAVRNLTKAQRRWIDDTLAGDPDRVHRLGPDELVAAVEDLANQARPDLHRQREKRAFDGEFFRLQMGLDGASFGTFALNAEDTQTLLNALRNVHPDTGTDDSDPADADSAEGTDHDGEHTDEHADTDGDAEGEDTTDQHDRDTTNGDADDDDDVEGLGWRGEWRLRREASNVRALMALCRQRLGLPGGTAPAAGKPTMLIITDLAALTNNGDGAGCATAQLLLESTHGPVELTHTAAQRLACEANWRMILTDGAQILGATATHPNVSATLRAALIARDGGCRWPGCRQPAAVCVNHHVIRKADGGLTILENVALLCDAHHHSIHDGKWANTLHPDGTMTFTRNSITITSLPRGAQSFKPTKPPPGGRPTRQRPPDPEDPPDHAPNQPPQPTDHPF